MRGGGNSVLEKVYYVKAPYRLIIFLLILIPEVSFVD